MLYDPKWGKPETKPDVFSLESLIAWLEKQPAAEHYAAGDLDNCLLGQFGRAMGGDARDVSCELGCTTLFADIAFPLGWNRETNTFGAALDRARSVHQ